MPNKTPNPSHLTKIKDALVNAGALKTATPSEQDQAAIAKELAKSGVSKEFPNKLVCHPNHFCIVVKPNAE